MAMLMGNTRDVSGVHAERPETNTDQPIRKCTSCYRQVHYVCLQNDDQAVSIPICRACASGPDGRAIEPPEAPCPPDGEQRLEKEDVPVEGTPLDSTGVVPCPTHGMDHLTRDPSCEFCKKALGPLYRHLKGKYGTRLDLRWTDVLKKTYALVFKM